MPVKSITAAIQTEQPLETDLEAQVLRIVARKADRLATPDILELRAQLDVNVAEQVPLRQQVRTVVDAISETVATWDQQEMGA
ncbi:hypothetical protein [Haloarcula amylovorans]|uniref:hypothetical protein n=1 Tax=Haloarcula amylovorans TaxID=2562280 RepID=UPI0010766C4F|nr:hypothetical protein [Halomicroarcula amylolytica]